LACHPQVGQRARRDTLASALGQTPRANLRESELQLEQPRRALDLDLKELALARLLSRQIQAKPELLHGRRARLLRRFSSRKLRTILQTILSSCAFRRALIRLSA
jgi:hypothetical protein